MNKSIYYRITLDLAIFFAVIHGFWFLAFPIAFVGVFVFPYYFELFVAGLAYDALFGMSKSLGIVSYVGTIASGALFLIVQFFKNIVRH